MRGRWSAPPAPWSMIRSQLLDSSLVVALRYGEVAEKLGKLLHQHDTIGELRRRDPVRSGDIDISDRVAAAAVVAARKPALVERGELRRDAAELRVQGL